MNKGLSLNTTKFGIFILAVIVSSTALFAQEPYMEQSFSVNDDARLVVETSGGSIDVEGSNTDAVRVEMYVKRRGRHIAPGEADLDNWEITLEKNGNTVYAKAKRKGRSNWGNNTYNISFKVFTPINISSDIRTSGGSISMENLVGNQNAKTSGGSIDVRQIGGDIEVNTSGGQITVEEIEGFVDAKTSGGRIRASNVTGGINAKTSGGGINLDNISGNVEAKTSGGSIDAEVVEPMDYIELRTSGGSISITVPKDAGFDLDLDGNRVRADLVDFRGEYERDEVEGTMNGGGTKLKARTSGGSVTLRYL
ncbi:MAG: DUF4097 family beta strand repeat protein [Balneolaceae bacterium]|nr:DUF4097 family beta strand repeat protein [Balneolaceae bacterium]